MSGGNDIPWNTKPKNGLTTFFTEETFNKWLCQDTHESRLDERLSKLGILPPPKLTGPILLSNQTSTKEIKDSSIGTIQCKIEPNIVESKKSFVSTALSSGDQKASFGQEVKVQSYNSLPASESSCSQANKHSNKPGEITETKPFTSLHSGRNEDTYIGHSETEITKDKELLEHKDDRKNATEESVELVNVKHDASSVGEIIGDGSEGSMPREAVTENVKPFSFYKEGTEEDYKAEVTDEPDATATVNSDNNDTETANNILHTNEAAEHLDIEGDKKDMEENLTEEQLKELEAQKEEEARKAQADLMRNDKMFFNKKDRLASKYFPVIYSRKPRERRSQLTCQEQKLYNELARSYGRMSDNSREILDDKFKKYIAMKVIVNKEQELFQKYLRSVSFSCKKDYAYIHPEVEKYAATRYMVKKQECFKYPRFYSTVDRVILTEDLPDPAPTLQYVRPLLELGSVCKLVLPNIVQGMPQPCVTTNFNKINEISPILKPIYRGTSVPVWNKVVCSQDANAEQLAVPNKCDIVMSSSAVRRLIDNQGKIFKYWDMPFTVREYQINEGEKTIIHKVVYIDKPFIRQSQYIPKDRIKLYQKHAVRALAIRNNVRGYVFCGIKPIHELVKSPKLDEVEHDVNFYEEKIKETVDQSGNLFKDGDDEVGHADTKKRKRKHGQGGMFDLDKDIDDLETFGMDMGDRTKLKVDGNKSSPEGKIHLFTDQTVASSEHVKKGRKSVDDDLEFLKNELIGIKTQAIKESSKHLEVFKACHGKEDKIETQSSETQKTDKSSDNNKESHEMTVEKTENDKGVPQQNECEVTDLKHSDGEMNDDGDITNLISEKHDKEKASENSGENISVKDVKLSRKTRKTKKDILTVKNMSSLSEKLKQMSKIKSKLMHRSQGTDDIAQLMNRKRSRSKSLETMETSSNNGSDDDQNNPDGIDKESKIVQKLSENSVDSDSEVEGLVIDVPAESPLQRCKKDMPKSPDMPKLERILDIPINEENQAMSSESEFGSPHLVIAIDEVEEAGDKSQGKKRRSTDDFAVNVTASKRILRSSISQDLSDTSKAGDLSQESGKDEQKRISRKEVISTKPSPLGRGKKLDDQSVSTRSRSVSSENAVIEPGTNSINISRRVTRSSTGCLASSKEEKTTQPVQVRKGRGRTRKNAIVTENTIEKDQISKESVDESKMNVDINEDVPVDLENDTGVDSELENIEEGVDSDNNESVTRTRNKATVRMIDSDDESSNSSREKHEIVCHSKQHSSSKKNDSKKELTDKEARKIKEMAAAMKKKIAEAKSKIGKEKTLSKEQSIGKGKGESRREEKNEPNKSVGIIEDIKADNKEENKHKKENKGNNPVGLDKKLVSLLEQADNTIGTGTMRGSAVDVFKQKYGISHCEFPVEGNVTYHQWKLGETNVLIRCKYHGFISGTGLVHISPKIEYQPNFGFEQDTISDICKNWISIYVRPNSSLLKPRINPFNSEIMMFENIAYNDLIPPDSLFKPEQAFTDLQVILEKLKSLPVGQYLLKNNPRKDQFTVLKAAERDERGSFDLHFNNSSIMKCTVPSPVQWTPINPNLMLPHQRKMNFIPCTFLPKDAQASEKKKPKLPQPKKKKKKKRNNDN